MRTSALLAVAAALWVAGSAGCGGEGGTDPGGGPTLDVPVDAPPDTPVDPGPEVALDTGTPDASGDNLPIDGTTVEDAQADGTTVDTAPQDVPSADVPDPSDTAVSDPGAEDVPSPDTVADVTQHASVACIACHTDYATLKTLLPEDPGAVETGGG
jgi:hypothetical protein